MTTTVVLSSAALFLIAAVLEIGGGYLVWQWLREDQGVGLGLLGATLLVLYGIIPTFQPAHFGRVYAAYGGVFVVVSLLWGWWFDSTAPDGADAAGALLCVVGVAVLMYWPRS